MTAPLTAISAANLNTKSPSKPLQPCPQPISRELTPRLCIEDHENDDARLHNYGGAPSSHRVASGESDKPLSSPFQTEPGAVDPLKDSSVQESIERSPSILIPSVEVDDDDDAPSRSPEQTQSRDNEGLTGLVQAMEINEEKKIMEENDIFEDEGDSMATVGVDCTGTGMDDTAFSAFSAVPNTDMTLFARLGHDQGSTNGTPRRQIDMTSPERGTNLVRKPLKLVL